MMISPFRWASFSNWLPTRLNALSSPPEDSPAATICTMRFGKIFGCSAIATARVSPRCTESRTSAIALANGLFSVCSDSMSSASTTVTPAFNTLSNWRQNTLISRTLTAFPIWISRSLLNALALAMETMVLPPDLSSAEATSMFMASMVPVFGFPSAPTTSYL